VIHLDTSFLIRALARGSAEDRRLREWLEDGTPLAMGAVSWAEFLCGPVRAEDVDLATHIVNGPVAFLPGDAASAAKLFNLAGRRRGSFVDCMIAAIALRAQATLATGNSTDFRRFEPAGLRIIAP